MNVAPPEEVGFSSAGLRRIDEHLDGKYVRPGKIAGCLTLVARHGKIVHFSPIGSMDRERGKAMRKDTIFRIYSMTKPITSVALMMLYERGLFQLSDPVHKWIPGWENLRVFRSGRHPAFLTDPISRPMTVRDLLTHMSGLTYGFMERTGVDAAYRSVGIGVDSRVGDLEDFVKLLGTLPLEFSPGTAWNYSVASDVVGYLVQKMSGQPFDAYLKEKILDPLGMVDTGFMVPPSSIERFAANYTRSPTKDLLLFDDPDGSAYARPKTFFGGGSGLVSTAADYFRFAEMLRREGELDGARILSSRTLRFMRTNQLPGGKDLASVSVGAGFSETRYEGIGFGLGFSVTIDPVRAQSPASVGEFGWGGMASTAFWVDPKEDLTVVFLTQLVPSTTYNFRGQLKSIVYGALAD